jgi:class 3 adenylate cyclase
MGIINLPYEMLEVEGGHKHLSLTVSEYEKFSADLLDLGDISRQGDYLDALAAIFDLEGFTAFSSQIDPHLVVPEYLDKLLSWIFDKISESFKKGRETDKIVLWGKFPFFAKFLGDGILFLWDTKGLGQASMGNIIVNLYKICRAYKEEFLTDFSGDFAHAPLKLRCGIARGQVIAIGGARDFVGPCINMAARLQKVSQLSFAFPRKGFNPEQCFGQSWKAKFVPKKIPVRGIGEDEIIFVCKEEFDALDPEKKKLFKKP